jgi:5-methylcytosine-specific restriction endonuclease McrA
MREINRERLANPARDKRKAFKRTYLHILYKKQKGVCPVCDNDMAWMNGVGLEVDHIDPNRQDFNDRSNHQLVHKACNREKSSMSLTEQTKAYCKPMSVILAGGVKSE